MFHVLIVDDESLQREYLKIYIPLIDNRFVIAGEATDGAEALQFIERNTVDLIITDIKMPVMNGLELCKKVTESYPHIKLFILSGYEEFGFVQEAMQYKVQHYLLKPILQDDLQEMMGQIIDEITKEKNDALAMQELISLSNEANRHVVLKFLQALISDSHSEINSLYPFIHRTHTRVFEGEGVIMILSLDYDKLLEDSVAPRDFPIFKYILNQTCSEMTADWDLVWTFWDEEENTVILLSGTDQAELLSLCRKLFHQVNEWMKSYVRISITGSISDFVEDMLQIQAVYWDSKEALLSSLYDGGNQLFMKGNGTNRSEQFPSSVMGIPLAMMEDHPTGYMTAVSQYVELMPDYCVNTVYRFGSFMIKNIVGNQRKEQSAKRIERAWTTLSTYHQLPASERTAERVTALFNQIISIFRNKILHSDQSNITNEQTLIYQITAYIQKNYSESISLSSIADEFGISMYYLSHIFHKNVGESYIKFITKIRMMHAARLLNQFPEKIYTVAEKVGFINVKHFSYIFKKYYGMTPGEYQRNHMIE